MGVMKSLHYRRNVLGEKPSAKLKARLAGLDGDKLAVGDALEAAIAEAALVDEGIGVAPGRKTAEELKAERAAKAEASAALKEAQAEREAIRDADREADEERARMLALGMSPHIVDKTCPWPGMYRADEWARKAVAAGEVPPAMLDLRGRLGPPEPPSANTGWYRCGDSWSRVGSWPFPEYRYPGLVWRSTWSTPKPDDVPWEDEVASPVPAEPAIVLEEQSAEPPPAVAAEPEPPRAERAGKSKQATFAW